MRLFDAHCHLISASGETPKGLGEILDRASAVGVGRLVCCGTGLNDWESVLQLPERFPQVIPMIGIHPWFVSSGWKSEFQILEDLARRFPGCGIGETGLDFQDRFVNRTEQEAAFAAQLDLARALNRPVAVHCVKAWGRLLDILRDHPAPRVVLHAFSGAAELIPELAGRNGWFSFCGSVTYPANKRARKAVVAVPADRLLIESDSPDFPPSGCCYPNEPANVLGVATAVAELRGLSFEEVSVLTWNNASLLFDTV